MSSNPSSLSTKIIGSRSLFVFYFRAGDPACRRGDSISLPGEFSPSYSMSPSRNHRSGNCSPVSRHRVGWRRPDDGDEEEDVDDAHDQAEDEGNVTPHGRIVSSAPAVSVTSKGFGLAPRQGLFVLDLFLECRRIFGDSEEHGCRLVTVEGRIRIEHGSHLVVVPPAHHQPLVDVPFDRI